MYENMTYDFLLQTMLQETANDVQKIPGTLVYNALSALAFELEKLYIQADYIIGQGYADTADYENLVRIAGNRGIYPKEATHSIFKAEFNVAAPIGSRFNLKQYNYIVSDVIEAEKNTYKMTCEYAGSEPNELLGELTPITYIDGLESAKLTECLVAGEDADSRETLYKRYIESFTSDSFGGNVASYKQYFREQDGIVDCKIYPVWNGPLTVKAVLLGAGYTAPTEYLIKQIQEACDSEPGEGYGFAPIGHKVTVEAVTELKISVETHITFAGGYNFETSKEEIKKAVESYFLETRKTWASNETLTMYISRLESAILNVQGVIDVSGTTLNGNDHNLTLTADQIPVLSEVTNT